MISNVILIAGLTLLSRSIFAIVSSNQAVSDNYTLERNQEEIKALRDEIAILDNKIASRKSTANQALRTVNLEQAGYVPIDELEVVTDTLASL